MTRAQILVVEDEEDIRDVITYNLEREGFEVEGLEDGHQVLDRVQQVGPDLILLDLMLPGLDGIEVCRRLKQDPETRAIPVIMVTARDEETDVVLGLGLGADDYVTKPFRVKELVARVKSVLRRGPLKSEEDATTTRIERDGVRIDPERFEVRVNEEEVRFTATELKLLHFLASHPGRVFTRDHLISRVMGEDAVVIDRNIDVHVRAIRKKVGEYRYLIETIRGVGYRFKPEE